MVGVNLQDAAPFVNPKNEVGANSAGPLQTATYPNFAEPPEIFGNNKVSSFKKATWQQTI